MSVISAEQFKNKATRVVEISGFEEGEKIEVRIKPVSLTAMMMQGRILIRIRILNPFMKLFLLKENVKESRLR